jgi:membrane fusion protein (multidrug efflux system)
MSLYVFRPLTVLILVAGSLAGCDGRSDDQAAPPPPDVTTITVQAASVPNVTELPGRIEAIRSAEVHARVDGIVQRRLYQEGSDVAAGTPLFKIDPRDKRAALEQAIGTLRQQQAAQSNATKVVQRYQPLVSRKAVSQQEYDAAVSQAQQASAQVVQAKAAVDRARLELGYTLVRAPIAGRAGRAKVTEGALVSAASATLMTNVDQLSPIYATFSQSNAALLDLQSQVRSGALKVPKLSDVQVRLVLENGQPYGPVGHLDFADLTVDPQTGGQELRAAFPNPERILLPGQFVRARVEGGTIPNGVKVPARAVQISDAQATVFVVDRSGQATSRVVELGPQDGGDWVIRSGLKPGETVIVDGWAKVQPGQKVNPHPATQARLAGAGGN